MFSLEIEWPAGTERYLVAELWAEGSAGIVELEGGRLRAFFEDSASRTAWMAPAFEVFHWRQEEQRDWVAVSRADWEPLMVGERFFLVPEWRTTLAPQGWFRIVVNPGMAFGTGMHETTQLCLEALETYVHPGVRVLDVGTGAGILARAAWLWARVLYGAATSIRRRWKSRVATPGAICSLDRWTPYGRARRD